MRLRKGHGLTLVTHACLSLLGSLPAIAAPSVRHTEVGSFNYSRAADRSNSENVLVVWDDTVLARSYLNHWTSRWAQGTDWKQTY